MGNLDLARLNAPFDAAFDAAIDPTDARKLVRRHFEESVDSWPVSRTLSWQDDEPPSGKHSLS